MKFRITHDELWQLLFYGGTTANGKTIRVAFEPPGVTTQDAMDQARGMLACEYCLAACKESLPVLERAVSAGCDDPDTERHALVNHGTLKVLRAAIALADGK